MAKNVCRNLHSLDAIKKGEIDLRKMELGDIFLESSYTSEKYDLVGSNYFSSEYLGRVGRYIKESQSKL